MPPLSCTRTLCLLGTQLIQPMTPRPVGLYHPGERFLTLAPPHGNILEQK